MCEFLLGIEPRERLTFIAIGSDDRTHREIEQHADTDRRDKRAERDQECVHLSSLRRAGLRERCGHRTSNTRSHAHRARAAHRPGDETNAWRR